MAQYSCKLIACGFVSLVLFYTTTSGLECYSCNSLETKDCGFDIENPVNLTRIQCGTNRCRSYVQSFKNGSLNVDTVTRGCGANDEYYKCVDQRVDNTTTWKNCSYPCRDDLCNHDCCLDRLVPISGARISPETFIISLLAAFLFWKNFSHAN